MDTRYLELFPIINAAVKKYLVRSKYIKRIQFKSKDQHSILYSVEWTFEPNKAAPISHYFSVSSTSRTLYLELDVPGFYSHSSPTEKKMDLEIAFIRPDKIEQAIKAIAKAADSVASKVVSDMEEQQADCQRFLEKTINAIHKEFGGKKNKRPTKMYYEIGRAHV